MKLAKIATGKRLIQHSGSENVSQRTYRPLQERVRFPSLVRPAVSERYRSGLVKRSSAQVGKVLIIWTLSAAFLFGLNSDSLRE